MTKARLVLVSILYMIFIIGCEDNTIKRVTYMGTLFDKNQACVIGQDGAYSIPVLDDKVFWTFGDTLIGPKRQGYDPENMLLDFWLTTDWAKEHVSMTSNSGSLISTRNIDKVMHTNPNYVMGEDDTKAREIIPPYQPVVRKGRYRPLWPMDGIEVNGSLYVFYLMVDCGLFDPETHETNLDINLYGTGLAKANYPYVEWERLRPTEPPLPPKDEENLCEYPYMWWNNDFENFAQVPGFGTAVLKKPIEGYIYIYGSRIEIIDDKFVHAVTLARVKTEFLENISKYEYLEAKDPTWGHDPMKAITLFTGNANELSVSYNSYLGKYIAIYSYAGPLGDEDNSHATNFTEIHLRSAKNPYGPWSKPITVYTCEKSLAADTCYAAKEHPEYSTEDGKIIYATFVSHQRYFPELIKIEFR